MVLQQQPKVGWDNKSGSVAKLLVVRQAWAIYACAATVQLQDSQTTRQKVFDHGKQQACCAASYCNHSKRQQLLTHPRRLHC
jgi:hypothetical protein